MQHPIDRALRRAWRLASFSLQRPKIQIHRHYRPWWIPVFCWAVLLGWPCYHLYIGFVYPALFGRTYMRDYIEKTYPGLIEFEQPNETWRQQDADVASVAERIATALQDDQGSAP